MQAKLKSLSVALLLLLGGMAGLNAAEQSQTVKLEEVPLPAQKTILAQVGDGKLGDIDRVIEDGETRYDAELNKDGLGRSFSVAPDGRLMNRQVFMSELPEAVQKSIRAQVGEDKMGEIDKTFEDGKFTYDVAVTRNGKERSFTVGADGRLLGLKVFLAETPEAVQKTIRARVADGTVTRIDKNTEEEVTAYDVEAQKDGRKVSFSVDPDGKLIDEED